jgi:hypothetical protein
VADSLTAIPTTVAPAPRAAAPSRRRHFVAGALGLVALAVAAVVVNVRDRQGKEVARVNVPEDGSAEIQPDGPPPADKDKPFVLSRADGGAGGAFARLEDALEALRDGGAITVHGNGPFPVAGVRLHRAGLTLRAAPGFRPVFVGPTDAPAAEGKPWFELERTVVDVEGCDFRCPADRPAFVGGGAPWEFRNCRLLGPPNYYAPSPTRTCSATTGRACASPTASCRRGAPARCTSGRGRGWSCTTTSSTTPTSPFSSWQRPADKTCT